MWIPSQGSSETVAWAADPKRKYPFLVTFSSADLVARYHNTYRDQARRYGYEPTAEQLGWACPIYVAQTDERAREEAGRAVETLFNDFLRQSFEMLMPPGYTSIGSMKNFIRNRTALGGGKLTAEALIQSGTALVGSPETVLEGIERMRERTGFGILVALLQFGILSGRSHATEHGSLRRRGDAASEGLNNCDQINGERRRSCGKTASASFGRFQR